VPVLTIKLPDKDRRITFTSGRTIRDVLDETDIRVRAGCNGEGVCGLCRIRVVAGNAGEPSANELAGLDEGLLSSGVRLACQVKADHDLHIELLNPAPPSVWRCLDEGKDKISFPGAARAPYQKAEHPLGASVDLGTTHISITVSDIAAGRRLAGRRGLNPQASCGADVMTRLIAAKSAEQAQKLSQQVLLSIGDGLRDIGSREGIDLARVARVVLVGNTAMLALLSGRNHGLLLEPRHWTEPIDCLPVETASWAADWGISPKAVIEVVPPLAGFVGSDLLSGVLATRLMEDGPGSLLIDFGTNSEMSLWDGNRLWVTSAAGGPAFEGCGISCGTPAEPGAIWRVTDSEPAGELAFDVIGGAEPRGLCGSGLVDLLACLVRKGALNSKGQFASSVPEGGFPLRPGNRELVLTKADIDTFQRAKAAIGTGIEVLLAKAGMGHHELRRISIGGVFGRYLNIANARELGLLPAIPEQAVETAGNTALDGCEALLLSPDAEERLREIRRNALTVSLSSYDDFEALYLEHLYLQPMSGNGVHDRIVF
jgi:uncharacterized 2Fe-2S/4Fe-4S cluster protein (DUF4445 family)